MNPPLPLHETLLSLLGSAALAILIVRLLAARLVRRYKYLFCYLIVNLAQTAEPFYVPFRTNLYGWVFLATEWVSMFLYALMVFELYSILLHDLRGIARLAYRYSVLALTTAVALSFLIRALLRRPGNLMEQFYYFEFPVVLSLLFFMLLITAFLVYYPVPLHRNALVYAIGYAVRFLAKAVGFFLIVFSSSAWVRGSSTAFMAVATACYVFWAICLNAAGERRIVVVGHSWTSAAAREQVLRGLQAFNESLLRSGPK